jgi:hypothetical protein
VNANILQQIEALLPALSRNEKVQLADELARQLQPEAAPVGQPLTETVKSSDPTAAREAAFWDQLANDGVLDGHPRSAAGPAHLDFLPIVVAGPPLSETILENRR